MIIFRLIFFILPIVLFDVQICLAQFEKDYSRSAVSFVEKNIREAQGLSLFVSQISNLKLITKHKVYSVSSASSIPLSSWKVVVDEKGGTSILSYSDIENLNKFIASEMIDLNSKKDFQNYIDLFIILAANNSKLIEESDLKDKTRIKDEFAETKIASKIEEIAGEQIRIRFFSSTPTGSIKMWNLVIKANGEIKKLNKTDISYN